ncbi:hypothetical protein [Streptomyces koyangensis]
MADAPGGDSVPRPRISCTIMAHPLRAAAAERLRSELAGLAPVIVYDPDPSGPRSTLRTAKAAWSAVTSGATHHLVLQDDAEPCPGFGALLTEAVSRHPETPLCLFAEWGSTTATTVRWAAMAGAGVAQCVDTYVPTVGMVLPAGLVEGLVTFMSGRELDEPDDVAMLAYLTGIGRPAFVTVPNLLEHDRQQSLMGHGLAMGRRYASCPAHEGDRVGQGSLRAPELVPAQSWGKGRAVCVEWDSRHARRTGAVPTRGVLQVAGLRHHGLVEALAALLADGDGLRLEHTLGYGLLHEVWMNAVALGRLAPEPIAPGDAHRPLARRALAGAAPGSLRTLVPETGEDWTGSALLRLVEEGVALGLAARPSAGPGHVTQPC